MCRFAPEIYLYQGNPTRAIAWKWRAWNKNELQEYGGVPFVNSILCWKNEHALCLCRLLGRHLSSLVPEILFSRRVPVVSCYICGLLISNGPPESRLCTANYALLKPLSWVSPGNGAHQAHHNIRFGRYWSRSHSSVSYPLRDNPE